MTDRHIGQLVRQELRRSHHTVVWLADKLQCNRTTVYKIFNRDSLDVELLLRISIVLRYNFFSIYTEAYNRESAASHLTASSD